MSWRADVIDGPIPSYAFLGLDEQGSPIFGDPLPAYNLNIAEYLMTPALEAYRITPSIPKRVFAGDPQDTAFLTFGSEAEAITALAAYWTKPQLPDSGGM